MGSSFYRSFEERHRGTVEDIKGRLSFYLPFLASLKARYPDGVMPISAAAAESGWKS